VTLILPISNEVTTPGYCPHDFAIKQ